MDAIIEGTTCRVTSEFDSLLIEISHENLCLVIATLCIRNMCYFLIPTFQTSNAVDSYNLAKIIVCFCWTQHKLSSPHHGAQVEHNPSNYASFHIRSTSINFMISSRSKILMFFFYYK